MADNLFGAAVRLCAFRNCRRDADPKAPWGFGFCPEHDERARNILGDKTFMDAVPAHDESSYGECSTCQKPFTADNPWYKGRQCRECNMVHARRQTARRRVIRELQKVMEWQESERDELLKKREDRVFRAQQAYAQLAPGNTSTQCSDGHRWDTEHILLTNTNNGCRPCALEYARRQIMSEAA